MKWVLIDNNHVNMDRVTFFTWLEGNLILFVNQEEDIYLVDPDKKHYHKLCRQMGVRPYEESENGNQI